VPESDLEDCLSEEERTVGIVSAGYDPGSGRVDQRRRANDVREGDSYRPNTTIVLGWSRNRGTRSTLREMPLSGGLHAPRAVAR